MSQIVNPSESSTASLAVVYSPVAEDLVEVEKILHDELRSQWPFVDELVRYGAGLGGKRLRPALLLLAGKAVGELNRDHHILAAVVEMIHTATLVHDDVLDEADMRRHLASVNSRWDNETSVLLGDYLFTHAFYLASTLESTFACRTVGRTTNIVCEGELRQVDSKGNFALNESDYFSIIESKTAELCACACQLGAHYAGAEEETASRLGHYGRCLGIAFQITDDLLDLFGDEAAAGKSLGTDLEKQKPTLPLIYTYQQCDAEQQACLVSVLEGDPSGRREELACWFERFQAGQYAAAKAQQFAQQARQAVLMLPASSARQVLVDLTEFVVSRSR